MSKLISMIAAAVVGAGLAVAAVGGVVAANTAAPGTNPASAPIVNYGNSK